jgi:hypothetical protein
LSRQADLNIVQALSVGQLRERHRSVLRSTACSKAENQKSALSRMRLAWRRDNLAASDKVELHWALAIEYKSASLRQTQPNLNAV